MPGGDGTGPRGAGGRRARNGWRGGAGAGAGTGGGGVVGAGVGLGRRVAELEARVAALEAQLAAVAKTDGADDAA